MVAYFYKFLTGEFTRGMDAETTGAAFGSLLADPLQMGFWMVLTVLLGFFVCSKGLQNGLEKISKIMMSALLILIVVLAVHSFTLSCAGEGIRFYLIPNLKTVKEVGFGNLRQLHGKRSYVSWRGTSDLHTGYIRCHYGRTDYFPGRFDSPWEQSNFATMLTTIHCCFFLFIGAYEHREVI